MEQNKQVADVLREIEIRISDTDITNLNGPYVEGDIAYELDKLAKDIKKLIAYSLPQEAVRAAPQVTDEQLLAAFNSAPFGLPGLRAVLSLSAPPAAPRQEAKQCGYASVGECLPGCIGMCRAEEQKAKPVAADWLESERRAEKAVEAVMKLADFYAWRQTDESRSAARKPLLVAVQSLAAAPQEQAPADKDAIRNAAQAFVDCATERRNTCSATAALETRFDRTRAALQKAIALQSQPQQVTK